MPYSLGQTDRPRGAKVGHLPTSTFLGFAAAFVAVLLIAFFSYRSLQGTALTNARVTHTLEVLEGLQSLLSTMKDAETGQRGFLLTGNERYAEPFVSARTTLPSVLKQLKDLTLDNPQHQRQLDTLDQLIAAKLGELEQTILLRRTGDLDGALKVVNSDRGLLTMQRIRAVVGQMQADERGLFGSRREESEQAASTTLYVTMGGSVLLLLLITVAGYAASREYRAREKQAWIRSGQMGLSSRIQGEQRLEILGDQVLEYLAKYLGAHVAAVYLARADGSLQRFAGYALSGDALQAASIKPGEGLLGQVAKDNAPMVVRDVPANYLSVTSSVGQATSRELMLAPAAVDGVVQAVLEFGFFRPIEPADQELLMRASESLGVAVRASKDRTRLEELLEETQRQSEELQTQQEELRVSNEELEEQARALKESQSLLEEQKTELERSNQYKSEFLANMSHELRTPLNSTLILAKLLADNKHGNLTAEQVKFAQTISSAGNDLLILINDILDLSKIEAGKVDVEPTSVHVARTVDGLIKGMMPIAQQKGLILAASIEEGSSALIETDVQRLGQILKNLLSNALKFTAKGEVQLRVFASDAGTLSFSVRDTGIGIQASQQSLIFEAFRQADGSTHRRYGGTGLGLSISRDLARLLGGNITLQSAPGQGSVFTLTLPLAYRGPNTQKHPLRAGERSPSAAIEENDDDRLARAKANRAAPPALFDPIDTSPTALSQAKEIFSGLDDDRDRLTPDSRRILVIEDDTRFASILQDMAHEMDFQCVVTHSAREGLAAASTFLPSAILLDINLPDHSGLGVLDQLKRNSQTRHIPVHVMSVADYSHEALELGAVGYAIKPVARDQLVEAMQKLEKRLSQSVRHVLVVEDDARQRESIQQLLANDDVRITAVESAGEALEKLAAVTFDCMVMDLNLPDLSGYELLEQMAEREDKSFPPVIVYTGRSLTRDEEQKLRRHSKSIIIKDARSPERLLDEVTLFLHQVESKLPPESQRMLKSARDRDSALDGRRLLVVEDDVRNIFALSSLLEPKGAKIEIARNGLEAIAALTRSQQAQVPNIDLVLMDIMMPEMDGITAIREIRKRAEFRKLPIIALTAKAMKDDQDRCMAAGANDYIAKPLDVEKLMSLIRVWLPK